MIKVENVEAFGYDKAIKAMRNPHESWNKSDSGLEFHWDGDFIFIIGPDDLRLMQRLYKAGTEHRTYARMIEVWMDVTAPLYWWKEADRYSVGKTQISTSTMHSIHKKPFELDDFSHEHLNSENIILLKNIINYLNISRDCYISDTANKDYWWQIIQTLPSSYNQKRTVMMSYETVFKIINERSGHKLDEWNEFVKILEDLPYVKEIRKE